MPSNSKLPMKGYGVFRRGQRRGESPVQIPGLFSYRRDAEHVAAKEDRGRARPVHFAVPLYDWDLVIRGEAA